MNQIAAYRKKVITLYKRAFAHHTSVASTVEAVVVKQQRRHATLSHLVLDMLMVQSLKAHGAVSLLAQHGLMEDTATIVRRLLELSVQAVYIGAESDEKVRERNAGKYIAFMWRQLPRTIKLRLPDSTRSFWSSKARSYGRFVPANAKTWGPNWHEMFKAIGQEKTYQDDYSFLSAIAHGRTDNQILTFSAGTIQIHDHHFTPILLTYSSKYYLAMVEQWNNVFNLLDEEQFKDLVQAVVKYGDTLRR